MMVAWRRIVAAPVFESPILGIPPRGVKEANRRLVPTSNLRHHGFYPDLDWY
jgi:hypothetical protein